MKVVLDSSALVAVFFNETGANKVLPHMNKAIICSVNMAEVVHVMMRKGQSFEQAQSLFSALNIEVAAFDARLGFLSSQISAVTDKKGLSLGDRACLALGLAQKLPILTADTAWKDLDLGADIKIIR